MLGNADQFDVGIAEFFQIFNDTIRKLSVIVEAVSAVRMLHPGTDVALINCQRLLVGILFAALVHPARI